MAIPKPWEHSENPSDDPESSPNWGRERARAHAGAGDYTTDHQSANVDNLVPFPVAADSAASATESDDSELSTEVEKRASPGLPVKVKDASKVWWSEAKETATAAWDGSMYRARPPSLRDIRVRAQRAEYAGDIDLLRRIGAGFGWVSVVVTAIGYALLWIARRPARLVVTTAVVVLVVVLAT